MQREGEKIEDWAARLRELAVYCELGLTLDTILRDRFVIGLSLGPERDRLFEQDVSKLTFANALELAQQTWIMASSSGKEVNVKEEP